MGEIAKVAEAFSAPIVKFIDVVSRGIGCAYEPTHTRKMADAKAYEITTIAKALRENADLPAFFDRDGVQIDLRDMNALAERASRRALLQEMRKQQNIEAIVDKAYEKIQKESEISSEPVDDDWIIRFFNSVEDVSNEKVQEIWGRILAGEISKPKSFSMRTLDVLKSITTQEATLLQEISFCILRTPTSAFIPRVEHLWEEFNIEFNSIRLLGEVGIINLYPHNLIIKDNQPQAMIFNDQIVGVIKNTPEQLQGKIYLDMESLTESGRQLLDIITTDQLKSSLFALKYFQHIKATYTNCEVTAFKVICETKNDIRCGTEDLLD